VRPGERRAHALRVALAGALLGAACAAPGARTGAPAADPAPAKALFEPYPVAEIVSVKDPHEYKGAALCQRCHFPDGTLTDAPNALCTACHGFRHGNHPVDVVEKKPVKDLPLLAGGKVGCHTCHDPHQKQRVLRKPFNQLCTTCHRRH
jgi:predicted CXXCH cytochrome family protein